VNNQLRDTWIKNIMAGNAAMHRLPEDWDEYEKAQIRLEAVSRMAGNEALVEKVKKNGVVGKAAGRNAEQIIGELTVPLSVVGPLKISDFEKDVWVPLSTTEGALVASVQRGVKAIGMANGCESMAIDRGMTRAPVFRVASLSQAAEAQVWLQNNVEELKKRAETTSNHLALIGIEVQLVGRSLFVRFRYETGEAMGMNMATIATQELVALIEERVGIKSVALSGNACVDKKAAWSNVVLGRGLSVQAEVILPKKVVEEGLKTTPEEVVEVVMRKDFVGSAISGSMGFNGHFANVVAALYLATGQDLAHVVEGSLGMTTAEVDEEDLYFSVNLPNVVVGTVGGGTHLPVQQAALEIMGLGQGLPGDKERLGRVVAATVLAGELSLTAALASGHLAQAHQRLGRKK
jgi:hydroxymethylglutaryl-CoA reductase (NADPH)